MKNKFNLLIFGLLSILVSFTSCHENFLEEDPKSLLSPGTFPKTADDADLVLGGISNAIWQQDFVNRSLYFIAEVPSDETVVRYINNDRFNMDQFTYVNSNQYITRVYSTCFKVINQSNLLIESLPKEDWAKQYTAAAKFYRAWMYSYLVRLWGPTFIVDKPTETVASVDNLTKSSETDVYNFIIKDLEEAENNLPLLWSGETGNDGRPTQGSCKMLLAKMYLSMAGFPVNDDSKWAMAKNKAQEVIDLGIYNLWDDFSQQFLVGNQTGQEAILTAILPISQGVLTVQSRPAGGGIKNGGWYFWQVAPKLISEFNDNDERKDASLVLEWLNPGTTKPIPYTKFNHNKSFDPTPAIAKWQDLGREKFTDNNKRTAVSVPIFRLAEAYLIIAEAENETNGPTPAAYNSLNILRNRAKTTSVASGLSKNQFRETIRKEWTLETAFEMKRRFNLLRWNTIDEVMAADERAKNGYAPYKKYLPIPQSEFDAGLPESFQTEGY